VTFEALADSPASNDDSAGEAGKSSSGTRSDDRSARNGKRSRELPQVLRCLFEEHRHLGALMSALENKARQQGRLDSSDFYLLRDIAGYLHDYPDRVHHPTENLLFEILLKRDPSTRDSVAGLRRDHRAVAVETQALLDLLDEAIEQPGKKIEREVRRAALAFAEHQRNHMQFENHQLFPAAIACLSREDWEDIETHFVAVEDPLFGRVVSARHRLLYEYLVDSGGKAAENFSLSGLFSLERLILSVELLEKHTSSSCARLRELGESVSGETRATLSKSLKPEGFFSALFLPVNYAAFLGKSLLVCSGDLARISSATARDALALYTGREPSD